MAEERSERSRSDETFGVQAQLQQCMATLNRLARTIEERANMSPTMPIAPTVSSQALTPTCASGVYQTYSQPTSTTISTTSRGIAAVDEFRQLFRSGYSSRDRRRSYPYNSPQQRVRGTQQWSHNFFCINDKDTIAVPSSKNIKRQLVDNSLGEKRLSMPVDATSIDFHDNLLKAFPQLSGCGGYVLMRCVPNSRNLQILPTPEGGHTPKTIRDCVAQSRVYIRPLQKSISLCSINPATNEHEMVPGPKDICLKCNKELPIALLPAHVSNCVNSQPLSSSSISPGPSTSTSISSRPSTSTTGELPIALLPAHCVSSQPLSPSSISPGPSTLTLISSRPSTSTTGELPIALLPAHCVSSQPLSPSSISPGPSTSTLISPGPSTSTLISPGPSTFTPIYIGGDESDNESDIHTRGTIEQIREIFPNHTAAQIDVVFELCTEDVHLSTRLLLKNDLKLMLRIMKLRMKKRRRSVEIDPNDIVSSFLSLYETGFDVAIPLEVSFRHQQAIDVGGVRRHFLSQLLINLATSSTLSLFEGQLATGVLPSVNQHAVMAGYFKMFGQVIVHSVLQEGPAFPYFPKSVFLYLCKKDLNAAVPFLTKKDLPLASRMIVNQILEASTDEELMTMAREEECALLLAQSGSRALLKLSTRDQIVRTVLLSDVIVKRQISFDHLIDGLMSIGFFNCVKAFPDKFEPLFVVGKGVSPSSGCLLRMTKKKRGCCSEQVFQWLQDYIQQLDAEGRSSFLLFCTGASAVPPIGLDGDIEVLSVECTNAISASTCFNTLTLPTASSYQELEDALNAVLLNQSTASAVFTDL